MPRFEICSEVTGSVWKVEVQQGEKVEPEALLVIVESMKMEIPVTSPCAGTVIELLVKEGAAVAEGQHVATIETLACD